MSGNDHSPASCDNEHGSALVTVLVFITIASLLTVAALGVFFVQRRFVQRDQHRMRARYAAEASLYATIDLLSRSVEATASYDHTWEGVETNTQVTRRGCFYELTTTASLRDVHYRLQSLVGAEPPPRFEHALVSGSSMTGIVLADSARITGSVETGDLGVRDGELGGRPFVGAHDGVVDKVPAPSLPSYDHTCFTESTALLDSYLAGGTTSAPRDVWFVGEYAVLTEADSARLSAPVTVVASRTLHVKGPLRFAAGVTLVAGERLVLEGSVSSSRPLLLYGREGVHISGPVRLAAQVFSRGLVQLGAGTSLTYPSLIVVIPREDQLDMTQGVSVDGAAQIDGTVIYSSEEMHAPPRVRLAPGAHLRGVLYTHSRVSFEGTLHGTLLVGGLYHLEGFTEYLNWMARGTIDVSQRPTDFALPLGFADAQRLRPASWYGEDY